MASPRVRRRGEKAVARVAWNRFIVNIRRRVGDGPIPIIYRRHRRRGILLARLALVAVFASLIARHYDPVNGFTSLILFSERDQSYESQTLQRTAHFRYPGMAAYDGQFYAQLALDPLLLEPDTDRLMDVAPFRARRILFSMTAWCLGLGRPAWILQAYALQNVLAWILLAWWLARRLPPDDVRGLLVWAACLFTQGLLASARVSVLDGPSLLLIALAVTAAEKGHVRTAAAIVGVSVLGRETNLLAAAALFPFVLESGRRQRPWVLVACLLLLTLPGLLWIDYLRSIYRSTVLAHGPSLGAPLVAFAAQWDRLFHGVLASGPAAIWQNPSAMVLIALTVQAAGLLFRPNIRSPLWCTGCVFAVLMLLVSVHVWRGDPGATARVVLPMTLAFNLTLPAGRWFWPWWLAGNLAVVPGVMVLLS
jgi:hypothetical protein